MFIQTRKKQKNINRTDGTMANNAVINPNVGIPALLEGIPFNLPPNEYVTALRGQAGGVLLNVELTADSRKRNYNLFGVKRVRETIPYKDDNGAFRYKTMTHKLVDTLDMDNVGAVERQRRNTIYLCCSNNGEVHFYGVSCNDNDEKFATLIDSVRVAEHIVDPMVAVLRGDNIVVAFNIPTKKMVTRGTQNRLPKQALENNFLFISTGSLNLVECSLKQRQVKPILRIDEELDPYYIFVASDAQRNPVLFAVNLCLEDATEGGGDDKDGDGIGFHKLFGKTFDTHGGVPVAECTASSGNTIPTGLSACPINAGSTQQQKFVVVQMSGAARFNVSNVEIISLNDNGIDSVRVIVSDE